MTISFKFTKQIYDQDALLKAAYRFTDNAYIHLDVDENNYIVSIEPKENNITVHEKEFQNEILAQMIRRKITNQTKVVRELMLARAFSSTLIGNYDNETFQNDKADEFRDNDILMDWFDKYEETSIE